jgi:hypothetical protein
MADVQSYFPVKIVDNSTGTTAAVTSGNAVKVDGSAVTQPVSGTITHVPSGTQTVAGTVTAVQSGTYAVSGTVTNVPSGTQTVAGTVTNVPSGTQPVSGTVTNVPSGTQTVTTTEAITDNAGFTDGTSKVLMAGFAFDESAGTSLTENDAAAARIDSKRAQVLVIEDATTRGQRATVSAAGAVKIDGSAVTHPVSGTITNVPSGTQPVSGTVTHVPSGTQTIAGTITAVQSGTYAVSGTVTHVPSGTQTIAGTVTSVPSGTQAVSGTFTGVSAGDVAHDGVDSGNPLKIGGQARTTNPTAVADADRVNAVFDKIGRIVTAPCQVRQLVTSATITLTNTSETTLLAAGGSGVFHDMTMLTITNTSGTAVRVDIRDTTGGSVIISFYVAASGGGAVVPFSVPLSQTSSNTNWTAQLSASVTDVRIFMQAVKNV